MEHLDILATLAQLELLVTLVLEPLAILATQGQLELQAIQAFQAILV